MLEAVELMQRINARIVDMGALAGMLAVPPLSLHFVPLHGFSTASNSKVPHNALHDARALRDHVMNHLE